MYSFEINLGHKIPVERRDDFLPKALKRISCKDKKRSERNENKPDRKVEGSIFAIKS